MKNKFRLKISKLGELRYISHLDWQNTFLKVLKRTKVKCAYSEGFNPTPKISFSSALPLYVESEGEFIDVTLNDEIKTEDFKALLEKNLIKGMELKEIVKLDETSLGLDKLCVWAKYEIMPLDVSIQNFESLGYIVNEVLSKDDLFIKKVNKKGIEKTVNIRKSIKHAYFEENKIIAILKTSQDDNEIPMLRADRFVKLLSDKPYKIKRIEFYDIQEKVL